MVRGEWAELGRERILETEYAVVSRASVSPSKSVCPSVGTIAPLCLFESPGLWGLASGCVGVLLIVYPSKNCDASFEDSGRYSIGLLQSAYFRYR